jgi:hypothetical protein
LKRGSEQTNVKEYDFHFLNLSLINSSSNTHFHIKKKRKKEKSPARDKTPNICRTVDKLLSSFKRQTV